MVFLRLPALVRVLGAAAAGLMLVASAGTAQQETGEDAIKAAFLYNFTKFIDWPESAFADASSGFKVCAFADEGFRRELEGILRGELVRGRPVSVAPLTEQVRNCHVAYFGKGEADRSARTLPALRQAPVLTVGEARRFLDQGGLVAFMLENDRVRFAISQRGAAAAGLTVSSKLLRLARPYEERTPR